MKTISRRSFIKRAGAVLAGGALSVSLLELAFAEPDKSFIFAESP